MLLPQPCACTTMLSLVTHDNTCVVYILTYYLVIMQVSKGFLLPGGGAGAAAAGPSAEPPLRSPDVVDAEFLKNLDLDF